MNDGNPTTEMPRYRCHKEVWALKIHSIEPTPSAPGEESDGLYIIIPEDKGYAAFTVDAQYFHKHEPKAGGYYVVYEDGYKSFSPAPAFESGHTLIR